MNKHLIILPILLTSAISLHALSFYLEEPEQIAQNPKPTISSSSQPSGAPSGEASKEPINNSSNTPNPSDSPALVASNASSKPTDPNKTPEAVNSGEAKPDNKNNQVSPKPAESKKPVPVASASVIPVATPSPKVDKIEVATNYIKPKNTNDIVKEARMLGGRLDPFLSLKPPEIRDIPSIPVIEEDPKNVSTSKVNNKTGISKVPKILVKRTPPPGETPQQKSNRLAQERRENEKRKSDAIKASKIEKTRIEEEEKKKITIAMKDTISKNLVLNGIISGQKPFAIISVKTKDGNESKVVAKNEELMEIGGDKIRVIAINTINNTVTVSNDNIAKIPNGKTTFVLSIKDES